MTQRTGPISALRDFLQSEAAGGIVLMAAAALALIVANGPLADAYHHLLHAPLGPVLTEKLGPMTAHLWINDGLMAIFFLLVGLEIKREFVDGRLATWQQRRLPVLAAAAGMAVPAIIYLIAAGREPGLAAGWAIPAATDIAFAIGVLALLGSRAPTSLKLFLTTVAIVDDMGAVAIIAIAYTAKINLVALTAAAVILAVMMLLNRRGVMTLTPYMIGAALLWYAVLLSGVHATIAGVLAAFAIPIKRTPGAPDAVDSPLHRLEHALHPSVAYAIVPLFGFANAGVSLAGIGPSQLLAPLPLGIAAGLFLGKQIGIFGSIWLAVKFGIAGKLRGATWLQIYGVSLMCGIGFTMSLFIGALAFPGDPLLIEEAKIGVLLGSLLSAIAGFAVLRFAPAHAAYELEEAEMAREIDADGDTRCEEEANRPLPH
ncbi:MAG: Na+/H+ antiporter NhaA [Sphingobium sp.]